MILEGNIPNIGLIRRRLGSLQGMAETVITRAINRTLTHISSEMAKEVRKNYLPKASNVKKTLTIKRAKKSDLSGMVVSRSSNKLKLYDFEATPNVPTPKSPPQAVLARLIKQTTAKALSGSADRSKAFIAKMPNGTKKEHVGVFQRQLNKQRKTPRKNRKLGKDNPIAELYGLSIPSMIRAARVSKELLADGQDFLNRRLEHEIRYALEKMK